MFFRMMHHKLVRNIGVLLGAIVGIAGLSLGLDISTEERPAMSQILSAESPFSALFVQPVQAQTGTLQIILPIVSSDYQTDGQPIVTATPKVIPTVTPTAQPPDSTVVLPPVTETASPTPPATVTSTILLPSATPTLPPTAQPTDVPPPTASPTDVPSTNSLVLYDDQLHTGFQSWSWASLDLANTSPVHGGSQSISVSYAGNYDGIWFVNPDSSVILPGRYKAVQFAIHGGSGGGQQIAIKAGSGTDYPTNAVALNHYLSGGPVAGEWRTVTIPLADLNLAGAAIANIAFQSELPSAQPTFYLDDILFIPDDTPVEPLAANIHIQTAETTIPVNPFIFGSNLPMWLNETRFQNETLRARTVASGVSILRMPGGSMSNNYDWLACENDVEAGTDPQGPGCLWTWASRPTDFLNFLRAVDIPGMWVVSPNGTAQEAAALVAFFNAEVTDNTVIGVDARGRDWLTAGHWAQLRADHGNPEPYPILWWEVGNEIYGGKYGLHPECAGWGWEEVWTCDGTEYVNGKTNGAKPYDGYLAFQAAMKAVDPRIKVGAVGVEKATDYTNWGNEVLAAAGQQMDFYSIHQYAYFEAPTSYQEALARPHTIWQPLRQDLDQALATHVNGRDMPTAISEFNMFAVQDLDMGQWMTRAVNALFLADTLGQMIEQRMTMAQQWDLANGETAWNGTDYGLMTVDFVRQPQYYVYPLWSRFGDEMLAHTSTVSEVDTLSVYAGRINANTLSILAINKTAQPIDSSLSLDANLVITGGTADVVQADSLAATSVTFNGNPNPPDDLSVPSIPLSNLSANPTYTFPPYSITLLRLNVEPR